jgi:hypothetical protein
MPISDDVARWAGDDAANCPRAGAVPSKVGQVLLGAFGNGSSNAAAGS